MPTTKTDDGAALTVMLLKALHMTHEEELPCDDVHELVDQYIELKQSGENVDELMPLMQHHLDMCRECLEEYEALVAALEFEEAL